MRTLLRLHLLIVGVLLVTSTTVFAQFTATGQILDDDGISVIGASILVKGTTTGTVTDIDGNYTLSVPTDVATIVVSYTGFGTQELVISSDNPRRDIVLTPSAQLLEQVVVTGYGVTDEETFTGAAAKVDLERVANVPRTNFVESLDGNVAGLQVNQGSGQPGAFQNVQIRGQGSINASSNPLYVIDGVPVFTGNVGDVSTTSSPLASINPADIADIQVLKDASATSIYGSRGANGVIVITTKRGQSGKAKISANVQTGISTVSLDDKLQPLTGEEYVELFTEGLVNRGRTEQEALAEIQDVYDTNVDTDWFDEITRRGNFTNASLSASGGTEQLRYFLSGGYQENQGTVIGTDFKRYSSRLNLGTDLTDWITINLNTSVSVTEQNTVPDGGFFANPVRSIFRLVPLLPVRNDDGSFDQSFNLGYNPVAEASLNTRKSNILNLFGSFSATVDLPLDGLTYEPLLSYNSVRGQDEVFLPPTSGAGRPLGQGVADNDTQDNWLVRNMLKYTQLFNDTHGVNVTLGMEAQEFTRLNVEATAENFAFPTLTTLSNGADPTFIGGTRTANSLVGYFGIVAYRFQDKFYVDGTFRRDGSSRFGSDNRYANFWSFGAGINLHAFQFLAGSPFIDFLRFRSSYGEVGNQAGIGNFASRGLYSTGNDYQGNPGILLTQLENSGLTWEAGRPFNVGFDFKLFDNRIDIVLDYYNRKTSSLLFDQPVSRTNGVANINANIGELENRGIELALTTQNIKSDQAGGFNWTTSFNFTSNVNEVTALPDGDFADGSYFRAVGQPWNTWYIRGYAGVNPDNGRPQWFTDETESEITENFNDSEPYQQGAANPNFFGGFRNTISFKGFSLAAQFNYRWGQQVLHAWHSFTHTDGSRGLGSTGNVARSVYERRWQNPGDITDTPQFVVGQNFRGRDRSTRFLYDGSFVTLRDVELSYRFPTALLQRAKFQSVRLFAQASNLWIYTKDDRLERDPRTDVSGFIDQEIPIPQTITFGLDATF